MKKSILVGIAAVFVFALSASFSLAAPKWIKTQTLEVPAYSSSMNPVHVESGVLKAGKCYKVVAKGTYDANDGITADAEYSVRVPSSNGVWTDAVSAYESYGETLLDLYMNNDHDWGSFSPEHKYVKYVKGEGKPLDFYINDIYPINNSGSLQVKINRIRCKYEPVPKATGDIWMSGPSQRMKFNAFDFGDDSNSDKGMVEYWNFDYPGPLHYKAKVLCADVNDDEARFMFQIPNGWPGLTGLYVLAAVKDGGTPGTKDTYGHAATSNLATAQNWCEDGVGVTNYRIYKGNLVVHD